MPGSFYSDTFADSRGGMTSTGAPSQPKGAPGTSLAGGANGQTYGAPGSWASPSSSPAPSSPMGPSPYNPSGGVPWARQALNSVMAGNKAVQSQALQSFQQNPYSGVQSIVDTMYGPQQLQLGQQLARQYDNLGMIGEDVNYRQGALTRDNALANQLLGIDRQALGIDKTQTGTQLQNLEKLRGILKKQYGLNDRDLATTMKQLGFDESQAKDMAKRKNWDLRSDLTQRGAFNTVANERGTGRIQTDLAFQLLGIGTQKDKAKLGWEGSKLGLDEKGIGYDNTAAGLNARLQNIGLDYNRLGINSQQLANSLQDGLRQIGLDGYTNVNNLLDAIGGTNTSQSQLANTILSEIMNYSNLPPSVLQQITNALGVGSGGGSGQKQNARAPGSRAPL